MIKQVNHYLGVIDNLRELLDMADGNINGMLRTISVYEEFLMHTLPEDVYDDIYSLADAEKDTDKDIIHKQVQEIIKKHGCKKND